MLETNLIYFILSRANFCSVCFPPINRVYCLRLCYKMGLQRHYFWNQMFCSRNVRLCYEASEISSCSPAEGKMGAAVRMELDWPNWVPWPGATSALNITHLVRKHFVSQYTHLEGCLDRWHKRAVCTSRSSTATQSSPF